MSERSRISPVSLSGSLVSLTDDYKASPASTSFEMNSTLSEHTQGEELEVTLGQKAREGTPADGRKNDRAELGAICDPYTPFASPPRTMPDIGNLSFSDNGSLKGEQLLTCEPAPVVTPPLGLPSFTLDLSSNSRFSIWSRWDSAPSTSSPYTPYTPALDKAYGIKTTPATSFSPFEPSASLLGSARNERGKEPELLRGDGHEGGAMSAEEVGRYLMITNIASDITAQDIRNVVKRLARFKILIAKHLSTKGCVTVVFFDPREAAKVYNYLQTHTVALYANSPLVELHCISVGRQDVDSDAGHGPNWQDFWKDVESSVLIQIEGLHGVTYDVMKSVCEKVGQVQHLQQIGSGGEEYLVEFWDTRHATELVETLNNRASRGMTVRARYYTSDEPSFPISNPASAPRSFSRAQSGPAYFSGTERALESPFSVRGPARTLFQPPATAKQVHDDVFGPFRPINTNASNPQAHPGWPTSRTQSRASPVESSTNDADSLPRPYSSFATPYTPPRSVHREPCGYTVEPALRLGSPYTPTPRFVPAHPTRNIERIPPSPSVGGGAFREWRASGWNRKLISPDKRINLQMIETGQETRTTVMVKDVPNKLSRQELVDILSDVVPGGFDFVYLRFDFKNACNVGYAFVNFTSLKALHKFHSKRVGQKWNMFSSEKVLQICWADIQGKERLINKLRNSDVMTAPEPWRPQIFYSSGDLKGCPEPFPEPDHPSRMRFHYLRHTGTSASAAGYGCDNANDYNYTSADFDASYGL